MHGFCHHFKIRIREIHITAISELLLLFPFDKTIGLIFPDQCYKRGIFSYGSLQFLIIHHKSAITANSQYFTVRIQHFGADSTWNAEAHAGKSIADKTGIRFIAVIMSGNPHLMRTNVGQNDIFPVHYFTYIRQNSCRFHRIRIIRRHFFLFLHHPGS